MKNELNELKFDLDAMVASEKSQSSSFWSLLQKETKSLSDQVHNLESHQGFDISKQKLTSSEELLNQLDDKLKGSSIIDKTEKSLQSQPSKEIDQSNIFSSISEIDKRIYMLETSLGIISNKSIIENQGMGNLFKNQPFPVLSSIQKLEHRLSLIDGNKLDIIRSKSIALKSELEAISKLKTGNNAISLDTANKLDDLLSRIKKVEAISEDLPHLIMRFKALEKVHLSASSVASRLENIEVGMSAISNEVAENKELIDTLRNGLRENLKVFQSNIAHINKMIAKE